MALQAARRGRGKSSSTPVPPIFTVLLCTQPPRRCIPITLTLLRNATGLTSPALSGKEEAMAEALVRQRIEDVAKALRAKDIDGVMSLYAPNVVSFDIVPPCDTSALRINVEPGKKPSLHILAPSPTKYTT